MDIQFLRLRERVDELGKHHRKFLIIIASHMRNMIERMENCGVADQVSLWSISNDPGREIRIVAEVGTTERESLDFMACYYALQFLQINVLTLDRMDVELSDPEENFEAYQYFLDFQARRGQRLHGAYMGALMERFLGGNPCPEYLICVVGTRSDQDDLDMGVIHAEGVDDRFFRKALTRTVNEVFRHGVPPHMYISERLGMPGYSATIADYVELLKSNIQDFVLVSELLSAMPLTGDLKLFESFQREVTDCYYNATGLALYYHEGFLRGLLGEMKSLLLRDVRRDRIHFKEDGLRLAKGMFLAARIVYNIKSLEVGEILEEIGLRNPDHYRDYRTLCQSMAMVEVFRFLYQIYSVQEEEVVLDGSEDDLLDLVAETMGFLKRGGVAPRSQLLVHYFSHVYEIRLIAERLSMFYASHIRKVTVFTASLMDEDEIEAGRGRIRVNLAQDFSDRIMTFGGQIFWHDVMEAFKANDFQPIRRLVRDYFSLEPEEQARVMTAFISLGIPGPYPLFSFLLVLHDGGGVTGREFFKLLVEAYLAEVAKLDEFVPALCRMFRTQPKLVNLLVQALEPRQRMRFEEILNVDSWDDEVTEILKEIRQFIVLRTAGSEFYRRIFRRVTAGHPELIHLVGQIKRLRRYSSGLLTKVGDPGTPDLSRKALADYYDVQYLACAVSALLGDSPSEYRARFIEFADTFIRSIYALCLREELDTRGMDCPPRDTFAVFASGGYARKQAFDDDFDLLLVLNSDDPEVFELIKATWKKVHREIVRRGTLPQYRLADHFGEFITTTSQIIEMVGSGDADIVDLCQLVGLRQVVGSSRIQRRIAEHVVQPYIFAKGDQFIARVLEDTRARREASMEGDDWLDIKDGPGGLRDVEQTLLMLNVRHQVMEPVTSRLFGLLSVVVEDFATELQNLSRLHGFLREVRDLYRITVAASDEIQQEYLAPVARIMNGRDPLVPDDPTALFQLLLESKQEVARISASIIRELVGTRGEELP